MSVSQLGWALLGLKDTLEQQLVKIAILRFQINRVRTIDRQVALLVALARRLRLIVLVAALTAQSFAVVARQGGLRHEDVALDALEFDEGLELGFVFEVGLLDAVFKVEVDELLVERIEA